MDESVIQVAEWKELSWLRHGFSTRMGGVSKVYLPAGADKPWEDQPRADQPRADVQTHGGDLNTGWTATDDPMNVAENRRRLVASVWGGDPALVTVRQVHSAKTVVVPGEISAFFTYEGRAAMDADGLMTKMPGVLLGIQTADCVPVLVADVRLRVVAGFHAGWRGTVAGIVENGIEQMGLEYGSQPEDLVAAVGPSIGACCYSVGDEVRESFGERYTYAEELFESRGDGPDRKAYLDLWEANRRQLLAAGVPESRITVVGECSGCSGLPGRRRYFSHRCENGFTGRMMSVIGVL